MPRRVTCGYAMMLLFACYPKTQLALRAKRRAPTGQLARLGLGIALCICYTLSPLKIDSAEAYENYKPTHYKQYILIQLNDFTEAYCLIELYTAESRLNPSARNGSHYGIPQGRSKYLATVGGTKQIDWGIKYNYHRYGSMCNALDHYKRKGWH